MTDPDVARLRVLCEVSLADPRTYANGLRGGLVQALDRIAELEHTHDAQSLEDERGIEALGDRIAVLEKAARAVIDDCTKWRALAEVLGDDA